MSEKDEGFLAETLSQIASQEKEKQSNTTENQVPENESEYDASSENNINVEPEVRSDDDKPAKKNKLGIIIVFSAIGLGLLASFNKPENPEPSSAAVKAPEVAESDAAIQEINLESQGLEADEVASQNEVAENNALKLSSETNTEGFQSFLNKDDMDTKSSTTSSNEEADKLDLESITPKSELSNSMSAELLNGLVDLESDIKADITADRIELGSVVTEDDIKFLTSKIESNEVQINSLTDSLHQAQINYEKRIAILEAEVKEKQYDLSFEKDRPEISDLIVSMATSHCDRCVPHASWYYQGKLVQKAHGGEWLLFNVSIIGDKLELTTESGVKYEYWSTHKAY